MSFDKIFSNSVFAILFLFYSFAVLGTELRASKPLAEPLESPPQPFLLFSVLAFWLLFFQIGSQTILLLPSPPK
jgi:hypothetical protein